MMVLQYKGISPISWAIKAVTWSQYSHSAIADYTGEVVEAWEKGGVMQAMSPWENHTPGTEIDVYEAVDAEITVWHKAITQVGKKYDYRSIVGFLPVLRHWWKDTPDKWFCSHLVCWAFREAGDPLFNPETPLYKIPPGFIPYSTKLVKVGTVSNEDQWYDLLTQILSN